jgi:hypothetical protein
MQHDQAADKIQAADKEPMSHELSLSSAPIASPPSLAWKAIADTAIARMSKFDPRSLASLLRAFDTAQVRGFWSLPFISNATLYALPIQ